MNLKLVSVLSIVGLVACGDSNSTSGGSDSGGSSSSNGGGGEGGDGGMPVGGGPGIGAGPGNGGGGGEPDCYDDGAAAGLIPLTVTVGQDVCTPALVDQFIADCIDMTATQATCDAFIAANAACSTCMGYAPEGTMLVNFPAILPGGDYIFLASAACEAGVKNLPDCAQPASDLVFCLYQTCGTCEQMQELPDCIGYSEMNVCGEAYPVTTECQEALFPMMGMESAQCSGSDFLDGLANIGNYFCGPPAP